MSAKESPAAEQPGSPTSSSSDAASVAHQRKPVLALVRNGNGYVDANGQLFETPTDARICQLEDQLAGAEKEIRAWRSRYSDLKRDREDEARRHAAWPTLVALFDYWRELSGHTKAQWSADRFWQALPLWRAWGTGNVAAGIAGITYQPNSKLLRNGKLEVYNSWKLLFKDTETMERYIRRRPKGWQLPDHLKEIYEREREAK